MAGRLSRSAPSVTSASDDLMAALGDLSAAIRRWLALQPAAQEIPVYATRAKQASVDAVGHAGEWAGATAMRARTTTARAASATRTGVINLLLVAGLLWWVDRMLTRRDTSG